ncbi:monovalent cation/H+ antiporter subunit D [Azonexus sp.]|jgi:multicomponent K+:H+ antiporter subunit D|uniref:monovalent cation/H+ antiporter subunit D n=1 Tax=Azonexus sp. TaxID=1872668 RepID=UPI00281CFD9E|nr:monovalent cation/H+ antiporter subunit D [Azonexus sp.]MDR1996347.1 monovalent cation/H+ antiporter subunit D [Azonexus sp.]
MSNWLQHLPILPILVPMLTGALLLLSSDSRHGPRIALSLFAVLLQLAVAGGLLAVAGGWVTAPWSGTIGIYALGNWAPPFGIVLVVDRLAAVMLMLTATLGLAALVYSIARWEKAGVHYLPLFQFLLMGLNGTFLTGDLFNLFVFFEVMLAASYGLALHGSGGPRVRAGLHYIAVNLFASLFFLIAAALMYGLTGTLNLADLPLRVAALDAGDRQLFHVAAATLGVVFLVKAGAWPLNFWLPAAYGNAVPPVGAIFAILTKVGVYALLRLGVLLQESGVAPAPFGGTWLFYCGLITTAVGTLGILSAQKLDRLAAFLVIVSSGTLLTAFGFTGTLLTGPAIYYLISSVLGSGAFFMLIEMAERNRKQGADLLAISFEAFGMESSRHDTEHPDEMVGVAIPAAMAFLGLAFVSCVLLLTGLPPLSGFVGKFALLGASLTSLPHAPLLHVGLFITALILSGMAGLIALSRLGIRVFWDMERQAPHLQWLEAGPVGALLLVCLWLALAPEGTMAYCAAASESLYDASAYIRTVIPYPPEVVGP